MDLNKEFYGYKNDIFFTKFLKRTGSTCKVNTKSASISPPDLSFQIYYSSMVTSARKIEGGRWIGGDGAGCGSRARSGG